MQLSIIMKNGVSMIRSVINMKLATMGCRTRVFENRFGEKTSIGRGNLSFSDGQYRIGLAIECIEYSRQKPPGWQRSSAKLDEGPRNYTALQLHRAVSSSRRRPGPKQFPLLMSALWNG